MDEAARGLRKTIQDAICSAIAADDAFWEKVEGVIRSDLNERSSAFLCFTSGKPTVLVGLGRNVTVELPISVNGSVESCGDLDLSEPGRKKQRAQVRAQIEAIAELIESLEAAKMDLVSSLSAF
ncbi:MAG: hypothetical protein ACLFPA_13215 [Dichotomicrobium sp.]